MTDSATITDVGGYIVARATGMPAEPTDEGEYMEDQREHETQPEDLPLATAMLDLPRFADLLVIARVRRGYRVAMPFIEAIDAYTKLHNMPNPITRDIYYRTERGARVPTIDEILLLNAILRPAEDLAYWCPTKQVDEGEGPGEA